MTTTKDAYTRPMIAAKVASGVAADAIAADDATRETASTRVLPRTGDPARDRLIELLGEVGDAMTLLTGKPEGDLITEIKRLTKERDEAMAEIEAIRAQVPDMVADSVSFGRQDARHAVEIAVLRAGIRTLREALEEGDQIADSNGYDVESRMRETVRKALFATRGLAMTDPLAPEHTTGDACVASADAEEK